MTKEMLPLYLKKRRTFLFLPTSPPCHHSCLTTAICTCSHKADQQRFQTPNPHIKHRTGNSAVPHRRAPVSLHTENHWEGGQKPSPSCVWQHCLLSSRGLLFPKHKRGWPGWPSAQAAVWLTGHVCCGQHVPIFRLFGAGWYIPAHRLYLASWRGEEEEVSFSWPTSFLRFPHVGDEQSWQLPAFKRTLQRAQCLQGRPEWYTKILSNLYDSRETIKVCNRASAACFFFFKEPPPQHDSDWRIITKSLFSPLPVPVQN